MASEPTRLHLLMFAYRLYDVDSFVPLFLYLFVTVISPLDRTTKDRTKGGRPDRLVAYIIFFCLLLVSPSTSQPQP